MYTDNGLQDQEIYLLGRVQTFFAIFRRCRLNLRVVNAREFFGYYARTQHMTSSFSNSRGATAPGCPHPPGACASHYILDPVLSSSEKRLILEVIPIKR